MEIAPTIHPSWPSTTSGGLPPNVLRARDEVAANALRIDAEEGCYQIGRDDEGGGEDIRPGRRKRWSGHE